MVGELIEIRRQRVGKRKTKSAHNATCATWACAHVGLIRSYNTAVKLDLGHQLFLPAKNTNRFNFLIEIRLQTLFYTIGP